MTTNSDFPSDDMLWIKEVEMVGSLDELKSSRSFVDRIFQTPRYAGREEDCLCSAQDHPARIPSSRRFVSLEEQKVQNEDPFLRGRQIAFMNYDYFR